MGFLLEVCCKVVYFIGNMGVEVVFNWIIVYMEELDFVELLIMFGYGGVVFVGVFVFGVIGLDN